MNDSVTPDLRPPNESVLDRLASVNLNLLVPLLALLEEKSVTQAADRVGLSQPAMSHALKKLRSLLGDELLIRQNSGMELTPRAVELIGPLKQALHQAASLVGSHSFDPLTDKRTITLALTTSTAFVLAPRLSNLLAERAPHMTLKLKTGNMTAPTVFTDEGVDAVLITETLPAPYPRERLFDDRWVVIAPPTFAKSRHAIQLIESEPHILFEDPARRLGPYVALDTSGITYSIGIKVNDYQSVPYLVARTKNIAMHRFQAFEDFKELVDLHMYEFPLPIQTIGVDLVWNPWLGEETYKEWLRDLLCEAAQPLQERYLKKYSKKS